MSRDSLCLPIRPRTFWVSKVSNDQAESSLIILLKMITINLKCVVNDEIAEDLLRVIEW